MGMTIYGASRAVREFLASHHYYALLAPVCAVCPTFVVDCRSAVGDLQHPGRVAALRYRQEELDPASRSHYQPTRPRHAARRGDYYRQPRAAPSHFDDHARPGGRHDPRVVRSGAGGGEPSWYRRGGDRRAEPVLAHHTASDPSRLLAV